MKFKLLGKDNGKHRIELETGETLEVTDLELEKVNNDDFDLIKLPTPGTRETIAPGQVLRNDSQATHRLVKKEKEGEPVEGEPVEGEPVEGEPGPVSVDEPTTEATPELHSY